MTLISFFDEDPVDNIGDILYLMPKRCIFLGESKLMKKRKRNIIEDFVKSRDLDVELVFRSLPSGDIDATLSLLRDLMVEYPDSIFDVSGGTELLIAAAGIISGTYDIPMYQRSGKSGNMLWQYGCELTLSPASISVPEVIRLHSGEIIEGTSFYAPTLTPELSSDVVLLWEIAKADPAKWNNTCIALGTLANNSESTDELQVVVSGQADKKAFYQAEMSILADLVSEGFIPDLDYSWGGISFRFRDEFIRTILIKAGTLLELYTYVAANWADDRAVSICLDWDGLSAEESGIQTRNELDVMLTVGMLPVCISCKNGEFDKTSLYELETVSKHFAGRYAKKVLVTSYAGKSEQSIQTLEQRAKDMSIYPIFNVHKLSFEEFSSKLKRAVLGA